MKKVYDLLMVYGVISALHLLFYNCTFEMTYKNYNFITYSIPMVLILIIIAGMFYGLHKEVLDLDWNVCEHEKYQLYWISLIPHILFFIYACFVYSQSWSNDLLLIGIFVLSVTILEEFIFRRIVFIELKKIYGKIKAIFMSAVIFSGFYVISFLGIGSFSSHPISFLIAFFIGILYSTFYIYTKNIGLLILKRSMWNYIRMTSVELPFHLLLATFALELSICLSIILQTCHFMDRLKEKIKGNLS